MLTYSHAPEAYQCPFCWIVRQCANATEWPVELCVVHHDPQVTAFLPMHHYAGIRGNVLVVPNHHYENIFDIDCSLGADLLRVTHAIAFAMKHVYHCEGISTRQHNEPAGYQDVWHFHQHVFPRYTDDHLYSAGAKVRYEPEERLHHASLLRQALQS